MPGHAKITSMMTAALTITTMLTPASVKTGMSAFLNACMAMTTKSGSPLSRASLMYSLPSTSSMLERVSRSIDAAKYHPSASAGITTCRQSADPLEILGPGAGFRHERHGITREPDDEKDRPAQDEERDDAVHDASDDELRHTVRLLVLHLDVFPWIGIAGSDGREDVLPLLQHDPWTDRVDERVPEHGYQIVVLENRALDLLGELLALRRVDRPLVLIELAVEVLHADAVARAEASALEVALVPERPASRDPDAVQDDLGPGKLLETALEPLEEDAALHGLEPAANADLTKLRDEAFAPRVERGQRRDPVHVEPVRIAGLAQELLGLLDVARELGPLDRVLDVVVDPVAGRFAHPSRLGLVHAPAVDGQAHRLAHALVVERILRVLEAGKLDEERAGQHRRQRDAGQFPNLVDELAGDVVDDVRLTALEHGDARGRLRHRDHHQLLDVDRTVVAVEGLHFDLPTRLVPHELVGPRPDGPPLGPVGTGPFVA